MSPYVATLSVSPSLPCECLRSAAVLRRSAAVPPRFGDGTADFGDGVRRVWRRLAWRLARLTADRRGPRRYRRGRDARVSRSVAKYGGKHPRLLAVQIVSGQTYMARALHLRAADAKGAGKNDPCDKQPRRF